MLKSLAFAMIITFLPPLDNGFELAVKNGLRHLQGIGVAKDHPRALAWFYLAHSIDSSADPYIGMVEPYLSAEQIARARRIAKCCLTFKIEYCDLQVGE